MGETVKKWNPYYVEYARAHGRTPEEMREAVKGNADFMGWMSARWCEWRAESGLKPDASLWPEHHAAFGVWLPLRTSCLLAAKAVAQ